MNFSYQMYEMTLAALAPARAISDASRLVFANPFNPLTNTPFGKNIAAGAELFERMTRRYAKPAFGLKRTAINGVSVAVREEVVWSRPFCSLIHFARDCDDVECDQRNSRLFTHPHSNWSTNIPLSVDTPSMVGSSGLDFAKRKRLTRSQWHRVLSW